MNKISALLLSALLFAEPGLAAQQTNLGTVTATKASVGSTSAPTTSSILDTVSTSKGTRPCPSMTQAQRDAISSPATGLCVFNSDTSEYNRYNGTSWASMGGGAGGIYAGGQNLISNNSFETDTTGWTSTGTGTGCSGSSAFARTTTNGQFVPPGLAGACFDSASANETLTSANTTINSNDGIAGRSGVVSCAFRVASGTATHTLTVNDGTNDLITAQTITSSSTQWQRTSVNFNFPASGTVKLKIKAIASNEPVLYVDDCYMGLAENFNTSQVSQAVKVGSLQWSTTANCAWSTTSGSYGNFSNDTDCDDNPRTATGIVSDGSSGLRPAFTLTGAPAGDYIVVVEGATGQSASGATTSTTDMWRLYDGTTQYGVDLYHVQTMASATPDIWIPNLTFSFTLSATFTGTLDLQAKVSGTNAKAIVYASASPLKFTVYRFPTTSEQAFRPEVINWRVDASISGADFSLGTSAQTSYVSMTNGSETLTNNTSTTGNVLTAMIPCSSTNPPTGTTCSAGTEDNGISFTVPTAGDIRVCASFSHFVDLGATGTVNATFEVVETPNNAQTITSEGNDRISDRLAVASTNIVFPHKVCGTFSVAAAGQHTYRLMYEQSVAATINTNSIRADADSNNGQRDVHWEAWPVTRNFPVPVLVGSVTSNTSGQERIERAVINISGASSCSITSQSGNWISSVAASSTICTLTLASGIFSAAPACAASAATTGGMRTGQVDPSSSTSVGLAIYDNTGTIRTGSIDVICMGSR